MKQGSKRVRFSTSVMFSSSVGLELLTPAFPQYFLLLASVAKSEANHYLRELRRELRREQEEIITVPDTEAAEVAQILADYGMEPHEYRSVVDALRKNPQAWLDFMMKFELGLDNPDPRRALQSAFTIAVSYIIGGLVPLIPYMFIPSAGKAYVFTDTSNW